MLPSIQDAKAQLEMATVCCNSFSGLSYADLKLDTDTIIYIDDKSPALDFDTGKSFFAAFRLPALKDSAIFTVKSYFGGDVFFPVVTTLDSDFRRVRTVSRPEFKYLGPGFIGRGRIEGAIRFDPSSGEKYLVIHTTSALIGSSLETPGVGYTTYIGGTYVYVPGGTSAHRYTTVGYMSISLEREDSGR
jgi:maltose operon protein